MAAFAIDVTLVAAVAACALLLLRLLLKYAEFRKLEMAIPGPPSTLFLGNTLEIARITEETAFSTAIQMWGGRTELSRVCLLNKLLVFVSDPDDLAAALRRKEFSDKARFFYEFLGHLTPKGLIPLNGREWKCHRVASQPAFHREVLESYQEIFVEEAENFVKRIVPNQEQDLRDNLYLTPSRAFLRTAMTSEVDNERLLLDVACFLLAFVRALNERSFKPWLWSDWVFARTATSKALEKGVARVRAFGMQVLKDRKEKLAAGTASSDQDYIKKRKTLLDVLIDAQADDKGDVKIEDSHIMDEIVLFLLAAVETSNSNLGAAFKCLSFYPDVQEKLYAEVKEVLGEAKRAVTLDDLAKMTYLDHVLKETMRVLPAVPFVARQVHEKTEFAGKVLPAGTTMVLNFYAAHRDPRHWADPLCFNPDRFAAGEGRHPYAFLPFSAGSRNCIGNRYAVQLAKTVLATTLRDYRVDRADDGLTDHTQLRLTFDLATRMVGGTLVTFTPRRP